jgi:hypothetical protein
MKRKKELSNWQCFMGKSKNAYIIVKLMISKMSGSKPWQKE